MPKLISSYCLIDTLVKTTSPREGCVLTPRQTEVPTPIRLLAVPTVFKTVLPAGGVNLPNKKWGISTPHKHLLMAIAFAIFATLTTAGALLFGKDGSQII